MSHRRKHVLQEVDACPSVGPGQRVLRVCGPRGSNILEARAASRCSGDRLRRVRRRAAADAHAATQVEDEQGVQLLVRMPQRFNKMLWVKRGARPATALAALSQGRRAHAASPSGACVPAQAASSWLTCWTWTTRCAAR